jgi:hypothetical protein
MTGMYWGAIVGLVIGVADFFAMRLLASRVEMEETKTALRLAAIVNLVLFPVVGAFVGGLMVGE